MPDLRSHLGSTRGFIVCAALGLLGLYLLVYHLTSFIRERDAAVARA